MATVNGGGSPEPGAGPLLKLTRGPRQPVNHAEALGIDGAVGLGDKFEVDKNVLSKEFDTLLQSLQDNHDDTMRYKFRVRIISALPPLPPPPVGFFVLMVCCCDRSCPNA